MRSFSRRGLLALSLAGLPLAPALAQDAFPIPGKPIRMIVPFAARA